MKIHITSPAVISRKMEHHTHSFYRFLGDPGIIEIGFNEFNFSVSEVMSNILQLATTQVIHDTNPRFALDQSI